MGNKIITDKKIIDTINKKYNLELPYEIRNIILRKVEIE